MKANNLNKIIENFDSDFGMLTIVRGINSKDKEFWALIAIEASKYSEFKIAEEIGNYNLSDYGEILEHGLGKNPPEEILNKFKKI